VTPLKIIQVGLGPLGVKAVTYLLDRPCFQIIGALDVNPGLIGKDVAEVSGRAAIGVPISATLSPEIAQAADCAIITTVSTMEAITPQILSLVRQGIPVVTTCEEMAYPWDESPELAKQIDDEAKAHGVAVLGTGINPGFLMDTLPSMMTAVCQQVDSIYVERYQDASVRRLPFQKKIGAGQTAEAFAELVAAKKIRHVGLTESIQMIANALGWKLSKTEDLISPVIAEQAVQSSEIQIQAGGIAGVRQIGKGYVDGVERITLDFKAWIGEPDPHDTIRIKGTPDIESTIKSGLNGDVATCAITVNATKQVLRATPGLHTMTTISPVTFFQS
jgi:2,4-diaminopentanoate dehydrogenase